jgi:hypothetical protein
MALVMLISCGFSINRFLGADYSGVIPTVFEKNAFSIKLHP